MIDPSALFDLEAEQAVIGAALLDPAAADECLALLRPPAFYREGHRLIWAAIGRLRAKRRGCDVITLSAELQASGDLEAAGDVTYLSDLMAGVPTTANAVDHAAIVKQANTRRQIVKAARDAAAAAGNLALDVGEAVAALQTAVRRITEAAGNLETDTLDLLAMRAFELVEAVYEGKRAPGIPTGLPCLDKTIGGGLHPGELVILGGRPSQGKSALAQQIAMQVAQGGGRVLIASAEQDGMTVGMRALSHQSGVDGNRLRGAPPMHDDDWPRLSHGASRIGEFGPSVAVTYPRGIEDVTADTRRQHARAPLSLLIVDHLQHLRSPHGTENRNQAIGAMTGECKYLAASLGIAVLLCSQLNRQAPGADRPPRLHDLRESGEIEQLADVVLLLHRSNQTNPPPVVDLKCIVAKQRNGEIGEIALRHVRPTGRFTDVTQKA